MGFNSGFKGLNNFLHPLVTPLPSCSNNLFTTMFSNALHLCPLLNVRNRAHSIPSDNLRQASDAWIAWIRQLLCRNDVERSGCVLIKALAPHLPRQTVKNYENPRAVHVSVNIRTWHLPNRSKKGHRWIQSASLYVVFGCFNLHDLLITSHALSHLLQHCTMCHPNRRTAFPHCYFTSRHHQIAATIIERRSQTKYDNGDRNTEQTLSYTVQHKSYTDGSEHTLSYTVRHKSDPDGSEHTLSYTFQHKSYTDRSEQTLSYTVQHKSYTDRSEQTLSYTVQHKSYTDSTEHKSHIGRSEDPLKMVVKKGRNM